jgi:hypothetical protein
MKIAAMVLVHNGSDFIRACIENVYSSMDRILVLSADVPWNAIGKYAPDSTRIILHEMESTGRYPKMLVKKINFANEIQGRTWGLNFIRMQWSEITHILILDFDEAYSPQGLAGILNFAELYPKAHKFYMTRETYWKSLDWRIYPREPYKPLTIHSTGWELGNYKDGITTHREIGEANVMEIPPTVALQHHASWVRANDGKIREKFETFMHSNEIIPGWYEEKWEGWTPETRDFHPTFPSAYHRAIPSDPAEMPAEWLALKHLWKGTDAKEAEAVTETT